MTFDGIRISVFDLKKEIIIANNLGKANDFDLVIFDCSSNEGALFCATQVTLRVVYISAYTTEYKDDSIVILRAS